MNIGQCLEGMGFHSFSELFDMDLSQKETATQHCLHMGIGMFISPQPVKDSPCG